MMSLIIKFKKVIETLRKSTFLASFLISVSIGLIDIGIACYLKNQQLAQVAYWIGGGIAILPIVGYILYQARKSEGNMNIDELKQLSYKKNNKNIKL